MTDEEMAEEKAEEYADWFWGASPSARRAIKQAYLAGVKAGRPKWHKVADGDYPPCERGNYTINVLTDCGDIAYYNYEDECWVVEPSSAEIDPPVAWCEIPKYKE